MAQYVLNLGPFPEQRMEAFLTFSAAAAGDSQELSAPRVPQPRSNTSPYSDPLQVQPPTHPPWTSVKGNPTPSTAHYHVAFHFSQSPYSFALPKLRINYLTSLRGLALRALKASAHMLQVRGSQTLKVNPSCSTLENTQPCTHTCAHVSSHKLTQPTAAPPKPHGPSSKTSRLESPYSGQ